MRDLEAQLEVTTGLRKRKGQHPNLAEVVLPLSPPP